MKKGIGLIERVKRGFGQSDIIYVKNFIRTEAAEETQRYLKRKSRLLEIGKVSLLRTEKNVHPRSEKSTYGGSEKSTY